MLKCALVYDPDARRHKAGRKHQDTREFEADLVLRDTRIFPVSRADKDALGFLAHRLFRVLTNEDARACIATRAERSCRTYNVRASRKRKTNQTTPTRQ